MLSAAGSDTSWSFILIKVASQIGRVKESSWRSQKARSGIPSRGRQHLGAATAAGARSTALAEPRFPRDSEGICGGVTSGPHCGEEQRRRFLLDLRPGPLRTLLPACPRGSCGGLAPLKGALRSPHSPHSPIARGTGHEISRGGLCQRARQGSSLEGPTGPRGSPPPVEARTLASARPRASHRLAGLSFAFREFLWLPGTAHPSWLLCCPENSSALKSFQYLPILSSFTYRSLGEPQEQAGWRKGGLHCEGV